MFRPRIIPVLLLMNKGLVKTIKFKKPRYLGDPINAVRIFNELNADELVFLDILASKESRPISVEMVRNIGDEAFMPFAVGGGIRSIDVIRKLLSAGAEKVVINSYVFEDLDFILRASETFGSSTIIVSIDLRKNILGKYGVYTYSGSKRINIDPCEFVEVAESKGAGEILVTSINQDGTMLGYDIKLIKSISTSVNVPVIACGGAGTFQNLNEVVKKGGASAAAAGSLFVYHGDRKAFLINYPEKKEFNKIFK